MHSFTSGSPTNNLKKNTVMSIPPDSSNTQSFRQDIFDFLKYLAEPMAWERKIDMSTFFLCVSDHQFHPKKPRISTENLTDEEKEVIRTHLLPFSSNIMNCQAIEAYHIPKDALSGMVVYRLEILPVFCKLFNEHDWIPLIRHLSKWESRLKSYILSEDGRRNAKESRRSAHLLVEAAKVRHRWWDDGYNGDEDCIHNLTQEYTLTD
ncbi:hypothetical protein PENTCL1PPCAC_4409 [Pristionchus entomophagus]|uniref:Uncharacterized protein n=1 Tax=Pristionchus entomophagus TaxID=358040 RepID=A0AAV5SHA6_9BILA|nr:hypothetical protein PENTCL1PPCAC_4409 [Pristionchus entomophagus]